MAVDDRSSTPEPPPIPPRSASISGQITARLPTTFSLPISPPSNSIATYPSHWLDQYRTFVRQNASQVSSIESALRSVTYILPGRFNETPLTSEAVYTSLTLLTAWHTHLLSPDPHTPAAKRLSPQTRYERWCRATGGNIYARAAALLRTVQYTQLLCEMFAKRAGEKARWRVVVLLEIIKAVCRMLMSRVTGSRPVIGSNIGAESQERISGEEESEPLDPPAKPSDGQNVESNGHPITNTPADQSNGHIVESNGHIPDDPTIKPTYRLPRTGLLVPTTLPSTSIPDYLSTRALTPSDINPPSHLVHPLLTPRAQLAELIHTLRPVIYALALQRAATAASPAPPGASNKRDWKHAWTPWLLGIGMEILARQLAKQEVEEQYVGGAKGLSVVEREEAGRRGWGMGWWAVRGGFYENVTKGVVEGVAGKLKGKVVLDMVGVVVEDYAWLWEEYYFSTATV